jgi:tetratricopeptide (TPR) repeat protein
MNSNSLRLAVLFFLVAAASLSAQEPTPNPWIGTRVMPKIGCQLKDKGQVIKDSKMNRVPYRVIETKDDWLLVGDRQRGWVKTTDVVPLEQAVDYYTQEIQKDPKSTLPIIQRAITYQELQKPQQAVADFSAALAIEPKNALALKNRAVVLSLLRKTNEALADFDAALKLDPNFVAVYIARGSMYYGLGNSDKSLYAKAEADLAKAIELDPQSALARYNYAATLEAQNKIEEAMKEYDQAIKLDSRDPLAYNNLAWIMATSFDKERRNGKRAVELAAKACELTNWKDAEYADTLAAAHAEAGNWEKAIRTAEYALGLVPADRRAAMQARLAMYQRKEPFRAQ